MALKYPPNFGWAGPKLAQEQWDRIGSQFPSFQLLGAVQEPPERVVLWEAVKKLTGGYLKHYAQQIGDCTGFGGKNAIDTLQCVEIVAGDREEFQDTHPSYLYGYSRVQVGKGQLRGDDGSLGSWVAIAAKEGGNLSMKVQGCPPYSGRISKDWGDNGPPADMIKMAQPHVVKSTARIRSIEEMVQAIANGYPCTIASMMGFRMRLEQDRQANKSFFVGNDVWPHQMCLMGYDKRGVRPGAFCMNQWGEDAHGPQLDGPPGGGWIDWERLARVLRDPATECFAFSGLRGFMARPNLWDLFYGRG